MFKIDGTDINLTRGDKAIIGMTLKDYTFQSDDEVVLKVYEADGLDKPPVLNKKVTVQEESDEVEIELTSEETKIGEISNEPVQYWYEIELNGEQTPFCYDEDGPKILTLYPEGADVNARTKQLYTK